MYQAYYQEDKYNHNNHKVCELLFHTFLRINLIRLLDYQHIRHLLSLNFGKLSTNLKVKHFLSKYLQDQRGLFMVIQIGHQMYLYMEAPSRILKICFNFNLSIYETLISLFSFCSQIGLYNSFYLQGFFLYSQILLS